MHQASKAADDTDNQRLNVGELFDPENAKFSVGIDLGSVYVCVKPVVFWIRDPIEPVLSE